MANIGGAGISARSMEQTEMLFPPLRELLRQEHGKITVLGNGFSALPITLAEMYRSGQLAEPPVIVDLFDYRKANDDLVGIEKRVREAGLPFPSNLSDHLMNSGNIREALESGNLEAVQYKFGDRQVPPELMNTSLAINVVGPPSITTNEQLSILRPGGRLLTTEPPMSTFPSHEGQRRYSLITKPKEDK